MTALGLFHYYARRHNKLLDLWRAFPAILKHMCEQEGEYEWATNGMNGRAAKEEMRQTWARVRLKLDNAFRSRFGWKTNDQSGLEWVFKDVAA